MLKQTPTCFAALSPFLARPAGQHFEIREEGDWWAAVPDDEWPDEASGQRGIILADFQPDVGDRRQEIVFIGAGMDEVGGMAGRMHALPAASGGQGRNDVHVSLKKHIAVLSSTKAACMHVLA